MRRLRALGLFTVGYMLLALLSPAVATVPALVTFTLASSLLLGPDRSEAPPKPDARER
jgi:hypothetical protein